MIRTFTTWGLEVELTKAVFPAVGAASAAPLILVDSVSVSNNYAVKTFKLAAGRWAVKARTRSAGHTGDWSPLGASGTAFSDELKVNNNCALKMYPADEFQNGKWKARAMVATPNPGPWSGWIQFEVKKRQ